eukprot:CAMPEP_0185838720 /NCGR_PEP_ID=MMETSP1353-20130828/13490_1 /TAXON_ID=1077150 /ORGANISM="Erythrolobus australicus, Strain CCMP3124" /LENGTH=592 /DNA_ID=CAMNT_0028537809 /DNA_START=292 /DNA_END=2070 /DNA_ORIENTATION=-
MAGVQRFQAVGRIAPSVLEKPAFAGAKKSKGALKRAFSGMSFCESFSEKVKKIDGGGLGKAYSTGNFGDVHAPMRREELLQMIDMLFVQAGLTDESSEEEVIARLGVSGLKTVLKFYNMVTALGCDLDAAATEASQSSLDVTSRFAVPDIDNESVTPVAKRRRVRSAVEVPDVGSGSSSPSAEVSSAPAMPEPMPALVPSVQYKKETEIALSRIFDLGKVASVEHPQIAPNAPYDGPPVVTMTGFGELGRWGNQILQYMFLKCVADKAGASIEVPHWVGSQLFGLQNRPVQRRFPAVIEDRTKKANSTFTDDFMEYIRSSNGGADVAEVFTDVLEPDSETSLQNVDVWGWFQWHTKHYLPHKEMLQDTFSAVPELEAHLGSIFEQKLRTGPNGEKRTVVGLHLRLGDYKNIAASSFGYCAPTSWYLEWLEKIWPTLENPVLFVASDEIDTVLRDFAAYDPLTSDMIESFMPASYKGLGAGMFPDWYNLTQCDVLAISNSSFSFSACMLNRRPNARFFRAHYLDRVVEIEPWNADPIVHREVSSNAIAEMGNTIRVLYNTQGTAGVMKNVLYELPYYGIRSVVMKAVLKARTL